jgi:protein-arginine deiminase
MPDLRADVNRDGKVDAADERGKDTWTPSRGAIFLPNLADSTNRCKLRPGDLDRLDIAVDARLAACNDASNGVVDGQNAKDLAPLQVMPMKVSDKATGRIFVPAAQRRHVRFFVQRGGRLVALGADGALSAQELRSGCRLAVQGRDIIRDPRQWDGMVTATLSVRDRGGTGTDLVRMRVAPVLLQDDLQRAQYVFAAAPGPGKGKPVEVPISPGRPGQWRAFADSLRRAASESGLPARDLRFTPGTAQWWRDIWRQDIAVPAYASMPAPGGERRIRILLRSPNYWRSNDGRSASLRRAGRLLFRDLRGPGVGVVQQYTAQRDPGVDDLLNFTGNIQSLPPYKGYPHGRVLIGSTPSRHPDPSFVQMLTAQGQQPAVTIDTSWLTVGHADETVHVVRSGNARGWTLAVSDPRFAVDLLRRARDAGQANQRLFEGTQAPWKPTIVQFLGWRQGMVENEESARHIDEQVNVLLHATGLSREEIVRLPVLYVKIDPIAPGLPRRAVAFSPGLANGLSLTARDYAPPAPHGPKVGGIDLFAQETERRLSANGVRVHWVEDFSWAHLNGGEVHCATNALRDTSGGTPWWRA